MAKMRRKRYPMKKRVSRKIFKKGSRVKKRNTSRPMRGGIRL